MDPKRSRFFRPRNWWDLAWARPPATKASTSAASAKGWAWWNMVKQSAQLGTAEFHRYFFEAGGSKPINRILWGRKSKQSKQWPQHAPFLRSCCHPCVHLTNFLSTASSGVSLKWTEPPLPMVSLGGWRLRCSKAFCGTSRCTVCAKLSAWNSTQQDGQKHLKAALIALAYDIIGILLRSCPT